MINYEAGMETYQCKKISDVILLYTKSSTIIFVLALFYTCKIYNNVMTIKMFFFLMFIFHKSSNTLVNNNNFDFDLG